MLTKKNLILSTCFIMFVSLALTGCFTTREYRKIQQEFNAAAEADNTRTFSLNNLGAVSVAQSRYDQVSSKLTSDFINGLDPKLKANAYTIKAISEWRTGKTDAAYETANKGLEDSEVKKSPRDKLILEIILPLVLDKELMQKYQNIEPDERGDRKLSFTDFKSQFEPDFITALEKLDNAIKTPVVGTPQSIIDYAHFQRWRILQNKHYVLSFVIVSRDIITEYNKLRAELENQIAVEKKLVANDPGLFAALTGLEKK